MEVMSIIQACLVKASLMNNVDISVLNAVASLESTYNIHAKSQTKDYGLMQLHNKKIFDPCKNAQEGAKLLKQAKEKLSVKLGSAWIIGYNLGVTGAKKFNRKSAKNFVYYKKFIKHHKSMNILDLLLFKDLPRINKTIVTIPYKVF